MIRAPLRSMATVLLPAAGALGALVLAAPEARAQAAQEPLRVTLEEAVQTAVRSNPALAQTATNVDLARFQRLTTFGDFLPTLNLGYGFSNSSTGRLDPTGQEITTTNWNTQLNAAYDIFDGLRRFSDLRSSREDIEAESARLRQARFETTLQAKQAFYNAVANRDLVRVEQDRVARQEDQLEFIRQQMELGRATRSDLLRSQVDLNEAKLNLLNAENAARASTFALAEAMGVRRPVEPVEEATLQTPETPFGQEERRRLLQIGLASGPSLASARAAYEAADAQVAVARSDYLPQLQFNGGWAWRNSEFPPKDRSWSITLQGNYALFNGFQRESQVFQAQAQADQARDAVVQAELALRTEMDAAFSDMESAIQAVALARQNVELSREDLRVSRERFRLGLATILDLQEAQINLEQAEVDLVQRQFDYQIALATLESLIGRSLPGAGPNPAAGAAGNR